MPIDIFVSYTQQDKALSDLLATHLAPLRRQGIIDDWYEGNLLPGTQWSDELQKHLKSAQIILLLISPDYLASDFCYSEQMQQALARHEAGQARVVPILLRPISYEGAPFTKLIMLPRNGKSVSDGPDKDAAFKEIVEDLRKVIKVLAANAQPTDLPNQDTSIPVDQQQQVQSSPLGGVWHVPFDRNPYFTGCEQILSRLHTHLTSSHSWPRPQIISGLGGIGKTQTALEYAYRYRHEYRYVLWVRADSAELLTSFAHLATVLNLPVKDEPNQLLIIAAIKKWLQTQRSWLLIFDNVDDLQTLRNHLPKGASGHILLTSRSHGIGATFQDLAMETMSLQEGILFLLRRAKLLDLDDIYGEGSPRLGGPLADLVGLKGNVSEVLIRDPQKALLSRNSPPATLTPLSLEIMVSTEYEAAKAIVEELGGLPLALTQAAAYIDSTRCGLSRYLKLYLQSRTRLLKERRGMDEEYPYTVATTWLLSFKRVKRKSKAAGDLLCLCAFLHPDTIPIELITQQSEKLPSSLNFLAQSPFDFEDAISELFTYSLVRRDASTETFSMHRLVQVVLRDTLGQRSQRTWAEHAVSLVAQIFPGADYSNWSECERYLPHVQMCALLIEQWNLTFYGAIHLLSNAGNYLCQRGQYSEAERLNKQALEINTLVRGERDLETAQSLRNLGLLYYDQEQYERALPLIRQALDIYEVWAGPNDSCTLTTLNDLARLYVKGGEYEEAEEWHKIVLERRRMRLGPNHPDTAASLNDLAALYSILGRYEEAESLMKQAVAICRQVLGQEHPDTVRYEGNLALFYSNRGRFEEAKPLYERILKLHTQVFGQEHLYTRRFLENYTDFLRRVQKLQKDDIEMQKHLDVIKAKRREHQKREQK